MVLKEERTESEGGDKMTITDGDSKQSLMEELARIKFGSVPLCVMAKRIY